MQKQWYDKHTRDRHFRPGDQVLILLPTTSNKLLAEWQGPYMITRKLGKVNYKVRMPEKRKRLKIFDANMLCEWHSPIALSCWVNEVSEDDSAGEYIITWSDPDNNSRPDVGEHLSTQQLQDVHTLWNTFSSVMSETLGLTRTSHSYWNSTTSSLTSVPHPARLPKDCTQ